MPNDRGCEEWQHPLAVEPADYDPVREKFRNPFLEKREDHTDADPMLHGPGRVAPGKAAQTEDVLKRLIDDLLVGADGSVIMGPHHERFVTWWQRATVEITELVSQAGLENEVARDADRRLLDYYRDREAELQLVPQLQEALQQAKRANAALQLEVTSAKAAREEAERANDTLMTGIDALTERLDIAKNAGGSATAQLDALVEYVQRDLAWRVLHDARAEDRLAVFTWSHHAILRGAVEEIIAVCESDLSSRTDIAEELRAKFTKLPPYMRSGVVPEARSAAFREDEARAWFALLSDVWRVHLEVQTLLVNAAFSGGLQAELVPPPGPSTGAFLQSLNVSAFQNYRDSAALRSQDAYSQLLSDRRRALGEDAQADLDFWQSLKKTVLEAKVSNAAKDPQVSAEQRRRNDFDAEMNRLWAEEQGRRRTFDGNWGGSKQEHFDEDTRRLEFEERFRGMQRVEAARRKAFDTKDAGGHQGGATLKSASGSRRSSKGIVQEHEAFSIVPAVTSTGEVGGKANPNADGLVVGAASSPERASLPRHHANSSSKESTTSRSSTPASSKPSTHAQLNDATASFKPSLSIEAEKAQEQRRREMLDAEEALRWEAEQKARLDFDRNWDGRKQAHFDEDTRRMKSEMSRKSRVEDEERRRSLVDERIRARERDEQRQQLQEAWRDKVATRASAAEHQHITGPPDGRSAFATAVLELPDRLSSALDDERTWSPDMQAIQLAQRRWEPPPTAEAERLALYRETARLRSEAVSDESLQQQLQQVEGELDGLVTSAVLDGEVEALSASKTAASKSTSTVPFLEQREYLLLSELARRQFDLDQCVLGLPARSTEELLAGLRLLQQVQRRNRGVLKEVATGLAKANTDNREKKARLLSQRLYGLHRMETAVRNQLRKRLAEPALEENVPEEQEIFLLSSVAEEDRTWDTHREQLLADWHRFRRYLGRVFGLVVWREDRHVATHAVMHRGPLPGQTGRRWIRAHADFFLGLVVEVCTAVAKLPPPPNDSEGADQTVGNARVRLNFQTRKVIGVGFFHRNLTAVRRLVAPHGHAGTDVLDKLRRFGAQELVPTTRVAPREQTVPGDELQAAAGFRQPSDSWLVRVPDEPIAVQISSSKEDVKPCLQRDCMGTYFHHMVAERGARFGDAAALPVLYFVVKITLPFAYGTEQSDSSQCSFYAVVSNYVAGGRAVASREVLTTKRHST
ncbi:unnamed protein product [Amoebophrya sp. A120]|nr:unnamed protein product [Amoebophrya sp. A120]|eukprot:GSA120T00021666001.1